MTNEDVYARRQLFYAALRSDRFQQGTGHLATNVGDPTQERNCCLEVANIVARENGLDLDYIDVAADELRYYRSDGCAYSDHDNCDEHCYTNDVALPQKVADWYGFDDVDPELEATFIDLAGTPHSVIVSAAALNDDKGFTFAQIADAFEATYPAEAPSDPEGVLEP